MDDGIGTGEIDIFEDAGAHRLRRKRPQALNSVLGDNDDLAIHHVAHEARADDVERASLRRENIFSVEFADDERPDAEWIARADQLLVGERD